MAFPTLLELKEQVRRAADIENDGNHISDAEIVDYLNDSISALWAVLIDGTNGTFFAKNAPVLVKLGTNSYQLPNDFLRLVDMAVYTGGTYLRGRRADPQEYAQLTTQTWKGYAYTRYFLQWNVEQGRAELFIFPEPQNTEDIAVRYVPRAPVLSVDADELKLPSDWSLWAVYDSAIRCMIKNEDDPSLIMAEREKRERRIKDDIRAMGIATVKRIRDVSYWEEGNTRFTLPVINFRNS